MDHTSSLDEKSTWNLIWQVWIMLDGIVGKFSKMALEGRPKGICNGNLGLH